MDAVTPPAPPASTYPLLARLPVQDQVNRGTKAAISENQ
jgi:hypothetical protein